MQLDEANIPGNPADGPLGAEAINRILNAVKDRAMNQTTRLLHTAIAAPGKPWVWRMSFPDFHAEVDLELLRNGWTVGYLECLDMLGCDAALDLMDKFYAEMTGARGFAGKPALEAVSRGGLHAYRYAARHPERVACIYADTPVMDLKSWPLGWPGARKETADALEFYGFKDEAELRAWRGNPVDLLEPIAEAKIPLRHVVSLNDRVVPPESNTLEAQRRLRELGHTMDVVTVREGTAESNGYHFPLPGESPSSWMTGWSSPWTPGPRGVRACTCPGR